MKSPYLFSLLILFLSSASLVAAPLKVFILAGQSNMQGHAGSKTLSYMNLDPATQDLYRKIVDDEGQPKVFPKVHVAGFTEKGTSQKTKNGPLGVGFGKSFNVEDAFGPELTFGMTMQEKVGEPILIIKTAWGGKSLHTDYRPPSAGPYVLPKEVQSNWDKYPDGAHGIPPKKDRDEWWKKKNEATGFYYRLMIESIKTVLADPGKYCSDYDPKEGYEIAGMVWFQGFNDMVDGNSYPNKGQVDRFKAYGDVLTHFIRDVRKDLSVPKMPFVIGVMGIGGTMEDLKSGDGYEFRKAMAYPASRPEFKGNVFTVRTGKFWPFTVAKTDTKVMLRVLIRARAEYDKDFKEKYGDWKKLDRNKRREYHEGKQAFTATKLKEQFEKDFPDLDYDVLMKARNNAGYHYLGCGKTFAQIGQAFANALPLN